MNYPSTLHSYYTDRQADLLNDFAADASRWRPLLIQRYGGEFADTLLWASRLRFETLIPQIPYIGGDESWTSSFVESIRCLALFQEMKKAGKPVEETGTILYGAVLSRLGDLQPSPPAGQVLTSEKLMERRKRYAELSQERQYPEGYGCEFVPGDGLTFDYGYDITECATQKFYHAQGADEFLPFFCKLDFAYSRLYGLGLARSMTLAQGNPKCDPRFKTERIVSKEP